jgi:hypothetical protein
MIGPLKLSACLAPPASVQIARRWLHQSTSVPPAIRPAPSLCPRGVRPGVRLARRAAATGENAPGRIRMTGASCPWLIPRCRSGSAAGAQSRMPFKCSARRSAKATMVKVGLAYPDVGKTELPAINKFLIPWTRQLLSTTPVRGSSLMRVVPRWCDASV